MEIIRVSEENKDFDVNMGFVILYLVTCAMNAICVSWTTCGANQTSNIFAAKYDWSEQETRFYNTAINFSSQLGKAIGATIGGTLIVSGRKHVFLKYTVLSISCCLS